MSELRVEEYVMPAARLGPASPLVPFVVQTANLVTRDMIDPSVPEEEAQYIGYGYVAGCLPYLVQDDYDRRRRPRAFRAIVLENELLKATFLPELGGRLWSLVHKPEGRELLFVNPVFQPANMAIRDAWFSGGVEWNFCWIGHTPLTCASLFAARAELDDGTPVLRLWEWERVRQMPYQMDAWLPDGSPVLLVRVRLVNGDDRTVPIYWWSNIAVEERPDVRVLAPTDSTLSFNYSGGLTVAPYPLREGLDVSYPTNCPHAGDFFFRIPKGQYPWVASVDERGRGFFHSSTSRLSGRKVWVFGMGRGGRRWQEFLNTPGRAYIEIQGGLTRMQSQCLPMPPHSEWEWVEAYGPVQAEPAAAHGSDWAAACGAVGRRIESTIPLQRLEQELAATKAMAERPPLELLHRGSGWGALERLRRKRAGQPPVPASVVFDDASLSDEQQPWLALLNRGELPETPPEQPPISYMIQDDWREMLERSVEAGRSDHWAGWLHLGIMYLAEKRYDDARRAWETSLARRRSPWAYRHLAALAALQDDHAEAARLYPLAVKLAPDYLRLVVECGRALIAAGRPQEWLDLVVTLPPKAREAGRIRLLEARAALDVDDLDRAGALLENPDLVITDIREGEGGPAHLWYAYQAKRLAAAEGVPIDDELKQRVRREFPPPGHLEYRLGS